MKSLILGVLFSTSLCQAQISGGNTDSILTDIKANQTNGTQHVIVDSGGGGGGSSTVTQGSPGPSPWPVTISNSSIAVTGAFPTPPPTQAVTGTFWQATQPVSAASLPLPSGASTSSLQSTINTTLGSPFQAGGSIGNTSFGATQGTSPWVTSYTDIQSSHDFTTFASVNWDTTVTGMGTAAFSVKGTFTGCSASVFGSVIGDFTDSLAIAVIDLFTLANSGTNLITEGDNTVSQSVVDLTGLKAIRVQGGACVSGTLHIAMNLSPVHTVTAGILSNVYTKQSGVWNVGLSAGSNLVGKVSIDQTTPGTTNKVQLGSEVAQASTTSGQTGFLAQGAVTSATPAYTTAKTSPLSLTTTGLLRTDGSNVNQPVTGTVTVTQGTPGASPWPVSLSTLPALVAGSAVIGHVIVDTAPSTAVTNTGTFAVQSALNAETTKVIGTVNIASSQTVGLAAGSNVVGHVIVDTAPSTAVTGTFWQATQPISEAGIGNPCSAGGATLVSITGATSTTNATQIIALSGSTKIYICSLTVIGVSGTTPTFSLVQGTGSNCATGQTTVVQAFSTTANQLYQFATPVAVGVAGNELCYKDGGTSPVENYQITYIQQ